MKLLKDTISKSLEQCKKIGQGNDHVVDDDNIGFLSWNNSQAL